ncbi:MAG: nucleotidyl transferase AbiEii/AbiGii toxin family protein [Candidatus Eisenbacteria bacterium]
MIRKEEIRARAAEWQLRMEVVEKDYVLGWLLAGFALHPETSSQWIFKGGTCLKKCFFETYRFSEDLDFSLLPGARYTAEEIVAILREVAETVSGLSGLGFPSNEVSVHERRNLGGGQTFEGRIGYRGPLAFPGSPKVRIDITRHEPLLDGVDRRPVFHAYPDPLPAGTAIGSYTIDELFAEKMRALIERTRPRDLYDVIFILENRPEASNLARVRALLADKCGVKGIATPTAETLLRTIHEAAELRSEWGNMLGHQLPNLPPIDSVLARAGGLFGWLDRAGALPASTLDAAPGREGEELLSAAGLQYWGSDLGVEAIRFAGTNRLKVEFVYKDSRRVVEPYSLRRATGTGNLLLYAWEEGESHIKAFDVRRMSDVRATGIPFTPRYRVEFASAGPISAASAVPASHRSSSPKTPSRASGRPRPTRGRLRRQGAVFIYECVRCGKHFRHSRRNSSLRPHKDPSGHRCLGRNGRYVETR